LWHLSLDALEELFARRDAEFAVMDKEAALASIERYNELCGLSVDMALFYGYIAGQNAAKGT
jgi:predicted ATP-grasp superfamily ATP-dependent carboligase